MKVYSMYQRMNNIYSAEDRKCLIFMDSIHEIGHLTEEEREELFNDIDNINRLRKEFKNFYDYSDIYIIKNNINEMFNILTFDEIKKICSVQFFTYNCIHDEDANYFYEPFFENITNKYDSNALYYLKNVKFFKYYLSNWCYKTRIKVTEENFDEILEILLKYKETNNEEYSNFLLLLTFPKDLEEKLINYPFDENLKKEILNRVRAGDYIDDMNYAYKFLVDSPNSIISLAQRNHKFKQELLDNELFFDAIRTSSIQDTRSTIEALEQNNHNITMIKMRLKKYYYELLKTYDRKNGVFEGINKLKEITIDYDEEEIGIKIERDTFLNEVLQRKYIDAEDKQQFLQEESNRILSEIIVDLIFEDSIYNVFINIGEILHYVETVEEAKEIVLEEMIDFYKKVINIDSLTSDEKFNLLNIIKDKDIKLQFYEDIRNLKDHSYRKMKKEVNKIDLTDIDNMLSLENGVSVIDMRDKEYYIFLRVLDEPYNEEHLNGVKDRYNRIYSYYSLINQDDTSRFVAQFSDTDYIYGFEFPNEDRLYHVYEGNSFSGNGGDMTSPNRILTAKEIVSAPGLNEFNVLDEKINDKDMRQLKPIFVVSVDEIQEHEIEEAKRLNIPIVLIAEKNKVWLKRDDELERLREFGYYDTSTLSGSISSNEQELYDHYRR